MDYNLFILKIQLCFSASGDCNSTSKLQKRKPQFEVLTFNAVPTRNYKTFQKSINN